MKNEFYNNNGSLTRYGLACGYVDRKESVKSGNWKELYMEHSHFHVRAGRKDSKFSIWEVFSNDELTKARKLLSSINVNKL
jgi:hypothetical protein